MKINFMMTVDWEGRCLEEENIKAMELYNKAFAYIPTLHFMNAAYFTKDLQNAEEKIKRVIKPNDKLGLHIHCWRSLVQKANLDFRRSPSFVFEEGIPDEELLKPDCGHDLALSAYNKDELVKLIETSEDLLNSYDLLNTKYFRAGGWVANQEVINALVEKSYTHDFSALPPSLMKGKRVNETLYNNISPLWNDITITTSPYEYNGLWEVPNNACLADYMNSRQSLEVFQEVVKKKETNLFVTGFHQETAHKFIDHVMGALCLIQDEAKRNNIELVYDLDPPQ